MTAVEIYPLNRIPRKKWKGIIDRVSGELRVPPGDVYAVLVGMKSARRHECIVAHIGQYMRMERLYDDSCATYNFCLEDARRKSNMQDYVEQAPEEASFTFMDRMYAALAKRPKMSKAEARRSFTNPIKMSVLKGLAK